MKNINKKPPPIASWLLEKVIDESIKYSVMGDFEERFYDNASEKGLFAARILYWYRLFIVLPTFVIYMVTWRIVMFWNYLKIALRNLKKYKGYSFINIAGLTTGITCCMLIFLYVQYETSYDSHHIDVDRVYRIIASVNSPTGPSVYAGTAHQLIPYVKENFQQAEYIAKVTPPPTDQQVKCGDKIFNEKPLDIPFVDEDIFQILTFRFLAGDPNTALTRPGTVVITEGTARKYFDDENPMGKVLSIGEDNFEITGIIEDPPGNTIFRFHMLFSWKSLSHDMFYPRWMNFHLTFVKLAPGEDPENFVRLITQTINNHSKEEFRTRNVEYTSILQPIKKVHLHSENFIFERIYVGNILYIYIFSGIGVIIILITSFNFINLITARSSKRACEVGVRKVTGAQRTQLFNQFISESLLLTVISFTCALLIVLLLMGKFNELAQLQLEYSLMGKPTFIFGIVLAIIVSGIAAGIYPAFILSSFKPVSILRGLAVRGTKGSQLRKVLVVGQFALSITMIIGVILFNRQLHFMKNESLGFDIEQKLIINMHNTGVRRHNYLSVKSEFTSHPSVLGATFSTGVPGRSFRHVRMFPTGQQETNAHACNFIEVDGDFLDLYGLEIIAGRNLSDEERTNLTYMPFLANETAVRTLGYREPEEILNKSFQDREPPVLAIGVVRDFHYTGLQKTIEPFAISLRGGYQYFTLKVDTENIRETCSFIEDQFKSLFPGRLLEYFFLDEDFNRLYRREEQTAKIFGIFTFLGIFIACLGLFGLAAFTVEQRTKEIGIRKVLGASVQNIVIMLSREFVKWVFISNIIAWPVAYLALNKILQNFAYRINIGFHPFVISAFLASIIAVLTVSYQSTKAARTNPVDSLKYE